MAGDIKVDTSYAAEMDYPEHEKTFSLFLGLFKWGTVGVVALLVGMMVGLIMGSGVIASVLAFVVVLVVGYLALR
ncbi:aa3-type cytochrome c oxidase subunit IV [Jiella sonneratiae]|uniref:Aa3-type cytochrome c oxidase subunit IV n=1 Tax=Jiella sonneratiae TaxID=2816856 RepID=A0ABS3J0Y1_9HYPH|nr:aa3-type cytochrome c oxidase subunit IV [Jiella sonneratiae]MBO0902633.1 aa3-type cytochrome c oxidase subunit IV [Jiella sonneratiae]